MRFIVVACVLWGVSGCAAHNGARAADSFADAHFLSSEEISAEGAVSGTWDSPRTLPLHSFAEAEASRPVEAEAPRKDSDAAVFSFVTEQPGQLVVSLHNTAHIDVALRQGCGDESKEIVPAVLTQRRDNSTVLTVPRMQPGTYCLLAWSVDGDAPRRFGVYARTLPSELKERRCKEAALLTLSEKKERGVRAFFRIEERNSEGLFSFGNNEQEPHRLQEVRRLRFSHPQRLAVMTSTEGFVNVCIENGCGPEAKVTACKSITGISPLYVTLPAGAYVLYASPQGEAGRLGVDVGIDASPVETARRDPVEGNSEATAIALGTDSTQQRIFVDTLSADDSTSNSIGGAGAPDLFYSLNVRNPVQLRAGIFVSTFNATLCLAQNTSERLSYLRCIAYGPGKDLSEGIDETLAPGRYFLVVDGKASTDFGRAGLGVEIDSIASSEAP